MHSSNSHEEVKMPKKEDNSKGEKNANGVYVLDKEEKGSESGLDKNFNHENILKCGNCEKTFALKSNMTRHEQLVHSNEKPYQCDICLKKFSLKQNWQRHEVVHSGVKPYPCDICGKSFSHYWDVKKHRLIHDKHVCKVCGHDFSSRQKLKIHIRIHGDEWPIKCEVCGKYFTQKKYLNAHEKKHKREDNVQKEDRNSLKLTGGETPLECNNCGKNFTQKRYLQAHEKRHQEEDKVKKVSEDQNVYNLKPSQKIYDYITEMRKNVDENRNSRSNVSICCNICLKNFSCAGDLEQHQKTHNKKKLHMCSICGIYCNNKYDLKRHAQVHSGQNLYECETCGIKFKHKITLTKHKLDHDKEKAFKCEYCGKHLSLKNNLKRHVQKCHSNSSLNEKKKDSWDSDPLWKENHDKTTESSFRQKDDNILKCDICARVFLAKSYLKSHLLMHSGETPYKCTICESSFKHKITLTKHKLLIHSQEGAHHCDVCNKYFMTKRFFKKHIKIHAEANDPNESKSENSENNDHRKSPVDDHNLQEYNHNPLLQDSHATVKIPGNYEDPQNIKNSTFKEGETKSFQCDICMKDFNSIHGLKRHRKIHSGDTPFKCTICESSFRKQISLTKHRLFSHSDSGDSQCSFCNKSFVNARCLKKHMKFHTEVEDRNEGKDLIEVQDPNEVKDASEVKTDNSEKYQDGYIESANKDLNNDQSLQVYDQNSLFQSPLSPEEFSIKEEIDLNDRDSPNNQDMVLDYSMDNNFRLPDHDSDEGHEAASDPININSPASSEQDFCDQFSDERRQIPQQPVISGVRVYFQDGIYCEVSAAKLKNINIDQLNSSPRVNLSSMEPILRGRSRVLVKVKAVFQDCHTRDVLGARNANV